MSGALGTNRSLEARDRSSVRSNRRSNPPIHQHQIKRELAQPTRWSIMRLSRAAGGLHVKREERRAILSEYEGWAEKPPDDAIMMGGFLFFRYLQNERSDLLDFRAVGNKWQIVHAWIRDRVED